VPARWPQAYRPATRPPAGHGRVNPFKPTSSSRGCARRCEEMHARREAEGVVATSSCPKGEVSPGGRQPSARRNSVRPAQVGLGEWARPLRFMRALRQPARWEGA
jgi:hypothetical protein